MDTIQKAKKVISDAEASLRDLISEAATQQRYDDVKALAELADQMARLASGSPATKPEEPYEPRFDPYELKKKIGKPRGVKEKAPTMAFRTKARRRATGKKSGYPKFIREEDKLVKVGWSKKKKGQYQHRVPHEAVVSFARCLNEKVEEDSKFDIDGLFPVTDESGGEVPGYQVYVIVAWLRDIDVIEKIGRDGYVIRDKSVLRGNLDEQWNSLQPKSA